MKQETINYSVEENGMVKEEIKISEHVVPEETKVNFIDPATLNKEIEDLERQKSDRLISLEEFRGSYVNPIDEREKEIEKIQIEIDAKREKMKKIKELVPDVLADANVEGVI
jgi:vacuolar-type H+-ATPase subunit I/STV1